MENINKSLQEQDDELEEQANSLLETFENKMRCHICHICGLTFSGNNNMKEHLAEIHPEYWQPLTVKPAHSILDSSPPVSDPDLVQPSLGDYLAGMRDMISQQSIMITKLIAIHKTKPPESPNNNYVCKKCHSSTESTGHLENHNRTQHVSK